MPDTNWTDKRCLSKDWNTPRSLVEAVHRYSFAVGRLGIDLDPATDPDNPCGAAHAFTPEHDGLTQPWNVVGPETLVYVNPPYGSQFKAWIAKIAAEAAQGVHIVALLPFGSRSEQAYWQRDVTNSALTAVCFHRSRVAFVRPGPAREKAKGNPYASGIYLYNGDWEAFCGVFQPLGTCVRIGAIAHCPGLAP